MGKQFIQIRNLHKTIGGREILRGVNFEVQRGETMVLIGRSGSGKSVLLRHIVGLMKPSKGEVLVEGSDIAKLSQAQLNSIRMKIAIVFQSAALFDSVSVAENVAFPLVEEAALTDQAEIDRRVHQALEMVDLGGQGQSMPEDLSGGMRKRVALARAIVNHPVCILYDEPTAGLDPIESDSISQLIRQLQCRYKMTALVVTHDMKSAFCVADKIAFLVDGRIYFNGTPAELHASEDALIKNFITGRSKGSSRS